MNNGLKPYRNLKDTGVPWLGSLPVHWQVRRLRSLARVVNGATPASGTPEFWDGDITWITPADLGANGGRYILASARKITPEGYAACGTSLAPPGSIAVSTRAPIGHLAILGDTACVNQGCRLLVPSEAVASEYLYRCLWAARPVLGSLGQGSTFTELSVQALSSFRVGVPPRQEQSAIVRFLEHADRRIRRYICAREKLIALLEEQKQAIIRQAVTGQIDVRTGQPYPAYKDSGVAWLDRVPEHWERRRLKSVLRVVDRRSVTGGETLLSLRRDHGVVIYADHFARPPQGKSLVGFKLVSAGQLVVNRLQANNGLVFRSGIEGVVSPDYSVFDAKIPLRMQYLSDLLRTSTYRSHFWRIAKGLGTGTAGFLRVYDHALLTTPVFLPPEHEQDAILDWLLDRTADIERAKERQRALTRLVDKYRTRLIADVVTGKLDVREAVASLTDDSALGTNQRGAHLADSHAAASGHSIAKEVHA